MTADPGWTPRSITRTDRVTRAAVARFRATLDQPAGGATAPQGFHWCLCLPEDPTASLSADGHPQRGDFLPPVALPRRMWAASTVEFLAPIPLDADIERRSHVVEVREKTGATGPLVFVEIDHVTRADGVEAVRERQTIVYREAAEAAAEPPPPGGAPDLSGWDWIRPVMPGAPLLFRYSALTFNAHRIHYDRAYALEEERYLGLVVHGPLMATLLLDLCARRLGSDALARFRFKARSPAFVDEALYLVGRREEGLRLRVIGADGRVVMEADATPHRSRSEVE